METIDTALCSRSKVNPMGAIDTCLVHLHFIADQKLTLWKPPIYDSPSFGVNEHLNNENNNNNNVTTKPVKT